MPASVAPTGCHDEGARDVGAAAFIALVGSPNCGKTTLFNWLTGSRFKTVNYPGSTVDYSLGRTHERFGEAIAVMDTPGAYSLQSKSPDERVTTDAIFRHPRMGAAAVAIAVVDASQLSRQLLVAQQLLAARFRVVIALTMGDLVRARGDEVQAGALSEELGCAVVEIDGRLGGGVAELARVARGEASFAPAKANPEAIATWSEADTERAMALGAQAAQRAILRAPPIAGGRGRLVDARVRTREIDRALLHPVFGPIFFMLIMGTLFASVFWLAAPLMSLVDWTFTSIGRSILSVAPDALWTSFLADGALASVGAVLTFAPQIFILFFGTSILEDSGYLARSAALADGALTRVGLGGRSFVPLLSGFACAVPAMMAARTINSRRERLLTIFVIPLMSCSARLPVYALLLSFLFRGSEAWKGGVALAAIYFCSLLVGGMASAVANRFLPKGEPSFFMLELPVYRKPSLRHAFRSALARTRSYLLKAGPAIAVFALVIWTATSFPRAPAGSAGVDRLERSYAGRLGHAMQPAFAPMGLDWRVGVGLISAFAAREVFVSSVAMVFHVADDKERAKDDSNKQSLLREMATATAPDGRPLFTLASTLGLIAFFMVALQCLSTVAVSMRESGGWKLAITQLVTFNVAGYGLAVGIVQGLRALGIA